MTLQRFCQNCKISHKISLQHYFPSWNRHCFLSCLLIYDEAFLTLHRAFGEHLFVGTQPVILKFILFRGTFDWYLILSGRDYWTSLVLWVHCLIKPPLSAVQQMCLYKCQSVKKTLKMYQCCCCTRRWEFAASSTKEALKVLWKLTSRCLNNNRRKKCIWNFDRLSTFPFNLKLLKNEIAKFDETL